MKHFAIPFLVFLAGCNSTPSKITLNDLSKNTYVAFSIHCDAPTTSVMAYKSGKKVFRTSAFSNDMYAACGDIVTGNRNGRKIIKVNPGTYFFGSYHSRNGAIQLKESNAYKFKASSNCITYIGHIKLHTVHRTMKRIGSNQNIISSVKMEITDKFHSDIDQLSKVQPSIKQACVEKNIGKKI